VTRARTVAVASANSASTAAVARRACDTKSRPAADEAGGIPVSMTATAPDEPPAEAMAYHERGKTRRSDVINACIFNIINHFRAWFH
jgi:hypothetical protein